MSYVSLHNHSHYSILRALPSPKELLARAKELGQTAFALTDHHTFSGIWNAHKAAKALDIKLIVGAEISFLPDPTNKDDKIRHLVLLATNAVGYRNLLTLNRKGYDQAIVTGRKVIPIVDWKLLQEYANGIICLTGGGNGLIGHSINSKDFETATADLQRLIECFGADNLGVEVQPHTLNRNASYYSNSINQVFTNYHLIRLAKQLNLRVVPTSNTHYLKKEEADIHDVLLAIGAMQPQYSNARLRYNVPELYLKSADEIKVFFARNFGDEFVEQICNNTLYFADKCEPPEWIDPKYSNSSGKELPVFAVHEVEDYQQFKTWLIKQSEEVCKLQEDAAYLRFKCYELFEQKFKHQLHLQKHKEYIDRIEKELLILNKQGFSSYMLIVADYVNWAKKNGISVSSGRGSVGSSVLAYLLGVHAADPIRYGLIFERFQNAERTAPPDIDIDFATTGRSKVIDYIHKKYGADKIAFISNFSHITPKLYVRDIARSLEFGDNRQAAVQIGDQIADSIPKDVANSLSFEKLKTAPLFAECVKRYPKLTTYSKILGKIRNTSTHAAGLVIGQRSLVGLVPLRLDKDGSQALEYEKNNAEDNGLLKVDILGLSTLDLIDNTIKLINQTANDKFHADDIKYEEYDKDTYDLISRGDTFGVFQLGTSGGTIDLCKKIKPKSIEDLAIITTLARPAAASIREDFIKARNNKTKLDLIHPSLISALSKTHGFNLYDESFLQLGRDVAGWSLNESDRLRKMIKDKGKYPEKDKKLQTEFIEGAIKQGIASSVAQQIWSKYLGSGSEYTFNCSHAVLYSFTSYITAYLKAHYPIQFLLAILIAENHSNAPDAKSNIDKAKMELRMRKVDILPPDINKSQMTYQMVNNHTLLTGLDALKFVGEDAIKDILDKRPFKDFDDFMLRTDAHKIRSSAIQALAASGCMDSFGIPRKLLYLYCSDYRKKLQVWLRKHDPKLEKFEFPFPQTQEWSQQELYALEKHYLGEAFICSKREAFGSFFMGTDYANMTTIKASKNKTNLPSIKAEIRSLFELKVKKEGSRFIGQEMAKVMIEDEYGVPCSMTIFPEQWQQLKDLLKTNKRWKFEPGYVIHFGGSCNSYENEMGIILNNLYNIMPPPTLPQDLKPKKVSLKSKSTAITTTNDLVQELEHDLILEGLVDLTDDASTV